ncbi:hypothetical protein NY08_560 [Rhodococcus sp. B7740]|nr:hypothetical protein [Rhodococcus sp. B7740]AJW38592.1 hypothetical protein NY08_560 [Rhodococcus sp. B7740]
MSDDPIKRWLIRHEYDLKELKVVVPGALVLTLVVMWWLGMGPF